MPSYLSETYMTCPGCKKSGSFQWRQETAHTLKKRPEGGVSILDHKETWVCRECGKSIDVEPAK